MIANKSFIASCMYTLPGTTYTFILSYFVFITIEASNLEIYKMHNLGLFKYLIIAHVSNLD